MIRAKDCMRSLSPLLVTCLVLAVSVGAVGCSGMTGFRSVGTERPAFLGFWDRSGQASPTPENDPYVLSMRAGQARTNALAKRDGGGQTGSGRGDAPSALDDKVAVAAESAQTGQSVSPKNAAKPNDTTVRVSLGRPEPLPGLAKSPGSGTSLALNGPASQWKADTNDALGDGGPEIAKPGEREEIEPATPASTAVADRSERVPVPDWKAILSKADDRLKALRTYQMRVARIERVNGRLQPEEDILLSIRRAPKAVRLEWASGSSKGREVIYSSALDPRTLFVHMPSTAIPLPVMKIPVDSPMVTRNSRHSITEAGLETIIDNLRKSEHGGDEKSSNSGLLSYQGTKKPAGLDRVCHHFVRRTPSGETWNVYLDERSLLPFVVFAEDSQGQMIERYVYREIHENPAELAAAGAFEPDQRWGESKGFLSRFARAATGTDLPGATGQTTR